jgi:spore maturation protein SpmB
MNTFGADSLTARLASIFNVAPKVRLCNCGILWFGKHQNTRYALGTMLIVDVICVVTAILLLRGSFK